MAAKETDLRMRVAKERKSRIARGRGKLQARQPTRILLLLLLRNMCMSKVNLLRNMFMNKVNINQVDKHLGNNICQEGSPQEFPASRMSDTSS